MGNSQIAKFLPRRFQGMALGQRSPRPWFPCSPHWGAVLLGHPAGRPRWHRDPWRPTAWRDAGCIRRMGLALKGPLTTPVGGGFRSVNVRLREEFHLYANLRPAHTLMPGGRFENIDLVLIRENLEGSTSPSRLHPRWRRPACGRYLVWRNTRAGIASDSALRLRLRVEARPQEGHRRAQGQRAEGADRRVSGGRARGGARIRGPDRLRRSHRRCLRHAARAEPVAVRRDRDDQPVRRHPLGPDRGIGRRARACAGRQHRREVRDLRGSAWLGAGHPFEEWRSRRRAWGRRCARRGSG